MREGKIGAVDSSRSRGLKMLYSASIVSSRRISECLDRGVVSNALGAMSGMTLAHRCVRSAFAGYLGVNGSVEKLLVTDQLVRERGG